MAETLPSHRGNEAGAGWAYRGKPPRVRSARSMMRAGVPMRPTLTVIANPADRWMTKAACVGQALAYDESASNWEQRKAQAVCLTACPVLEECREWARRTKFTGTAAGEKFLYGRRRGRPGPAERRRSAAVEEQQAS